MVLGVGGSSPLAHPTETAGQRPGPVHKAGPPDYGCPILGAEWEPIFAERAGDGRKQTPTTPLSTDPSPVQLTEELASQMPRRRSQDVIPPDQAPRESSPAATQPKYPRPKILVADAPDVATALQERGYAAVQGTFGQPIAVPPGSGFCPLRLASDLPGHTEQEIVVADLAGLPAQRLTNPPEKPAAGVRAMWASVETGLVDPRPAVMRLVCTDMDRIYMHGGIFILFAAARSDHRYIIAAHEETNLVTYGAQAYQANNWGLLSDLQWLTVTADSGQEMDPDESGVARTFGIASYFDNGQFQCVVKPTWSLAERWSTLATNKYGEPVSGIIFPPRQEDEKQAAGFVFIFPQVERRSELVIDLIERVLPVLRPRLFPDAEGSRWTRRSEYDLPQVTALKSEILKAEQRGSFYGLSASCC